MAESCYCNKLCKFATTANPSPIWNCEIIPRFAIADKLCKFTTAANPSLIVMATKNLSRKVKKRKIEYNRQIYITSPPPPAPPPHTFVSLRKTTQLCQLKCLQER